MRRRSPRPPPRPSPLTRLNTPGRRARIVHRPRANSSALNGDSSLGFSTTVQPAASAGATLAVIWYSGQFHGVISAQTPIGSRAIAVVPSTPEAVAAQHLDRDAHVLDPERHCPARAKAIAAPISATIASRSPRHAVRAGSGCGPAARPLRDRDLREPGTHAAPPPPRARRRPPRPAMRPTTCSWAGSTTGAVTGDSGAASGRRCRTAGRARRSSVAPGAASGGRSKQNPPSPPRRPAAPRSHLY